MLAYCIIFNAFTISTTTAVVTLTFSLTKKAMRFDWQVKLFAGIELPNRPHNRSIFPVSGT